MIHIVGTGHSLQVLTEARRATGQHIRIGEFAAYVADVAATVKAELIAEEASSEWIDSHGPGAISIAMAAASDLGIEHLFCDPNTEERSALGLKVGSELRDHAMAVAGTTGEDWTDVHTRELREQFPAREAFWIERLLGRRSAAREVVFICGADHADSFSASLEAAGLQASIVCRDWTEI